MSVAQTHDNNRLSSFLHEKLIPCAGRQEPSWMEIAAHRRQLHLCQGALMTPHKPAGKPSAAGDPRRYRNASIVSKSWPGHHLNAAKTPKLACVTAGCADLQFYDYDLRVSESIFLFIPPDVPQPDGSLSHINVDNPLGFCEICWMMPVGDKLHFWMCRCENGKHTTHQWSNVIFLNQRLNLFMQLLYEEVLIGQDSPSLLTPHLLQLLILGLQREATAQRYIQLVHDEHTSWRLEPSKDPIEQAQEYVDAHFSSTITLESLGRMVGMSRSLFAQRFKQQSGQTLGEYLTARRLLEARNLLRQSEWTVATISEFVGFHSEAHFYNLFRRSAKCSPGEYRNKDTDNSNHNKK